MSYCSQVSNISHNWNMEFASTTLKIFCKIKENKVINKKRWNALCKLDNKKRFEYYNIDQPHLSEIHNNNTPHRLNFTMSMALPAIMIQLFFFSVAQRFFAKKTSIITFAGFNDERVQVTIFPPVLKRRSEGALVAGTQRYLRAMVDNCV